MTVMKLTMNLGDAVVEMGKRSLKLAPTKDNMSDDYRQLGHDACDQSSRLDSAQCYHCEPMKKDDAT